jgi:hypothetical protein
MVGYLELEEQKAQAVLQTWFATNESLASK